MAGYFFDSSALVKRYHAEAGTSVVDEILQTAGSQIRISRLTPAELTSAFAIKVRTQTITREDARLFLRQFREDVACGELQVYSIAEAEFGAAERLVERHAFDLRLRALDALQLAVALALREQELADHFVAADRVLCDIARLEGFSVVNPEHP